MAFLVRSALVSWPGAGPRAPGKGWKLQTSQAPAEAGTDPFEALAGAWNGRSRAYLRARVLADGVGATARGIVEALADAAAPAARAAFPEWLARSRRDHELVTLNAGALLALRGGRWDVAAALAAEVNARDQHDLLAQRLADAADARSSSLEIEIDAWLADRFCSAPFQQIETRTTGAVHFCCSAWQPAPIGNLADGSGGFWNSERARENPAVRARRRLLPL